MFFWVTINYVLSTSLVLYWNISFLGDGTTISAKPQIRNMRAEVTKLVPTALRIKRDEKAQKQKKFASSMQPNSSESDISEKAGRVTEEPTKDDVYSKFMKEMEGFL